MSTSDSVIRARPPRRVSRHAIWSAAAAVLSACYQYAPTPNATPGAKTPVQVTLTDAGSVTLASQVGPRIETIQGLYTLATPDSVILAVTQTSARGGADTFWQGERVAVPRSAIASIGVRRLSTARTALATVIGVGAVAAAIAGFTVGRTGENTIVRRLPGGQ